MTRAGVPWRLRRHPTIDSTQTSAIAAARLGESARLAILADVQTAGRGSRGRGWTAAPGNLNLSVLLRPAGRPEPGRWALLAGVALYEALAPYTDGLLLKWPNDLLLNDSKLGGVLIDSAVDVGGDIDWIVVGVGANLIQAPVIEGRSVACLPPPGAKSAQVAEAFLQQLDRWESSDIRSAWLSRAHPAGTMIDVVTPHRRVRGRFAGLSAQGELILEGQAAPIGSAEVFLPPSAHPPSSARCCSS